MLTCIEEIRQGNEASACLLIEDLLPLVTRVVRSHLPRLQEEADLVQMIFAKVFGNLDQYSGSVPVSHWVSRIAVNTCLNVLKAERVRNEWRWADLPEDEQHVLESLAVGQTELTPAQQVAARDFLEKLLDRLTPDDRLLVTLLYLEERRMKEVRRLTGWSLPAIKVRAFRVRHKLQKHLDELMQEDERKVTEDAACQGPAAQQSAPRKQVYE